jgi:GAF domain-containing protein
VVQAGETIGVIELINKEPIPFNETDMTLLGILSDVAARVFAEMQAHDEPITKGFKHPGDIEDLELNIEDFTS